MSINCFFFLISSILLFLNFFIIVKYIFILQIIGITFNILITVTIFSFFILSFFQSYRRDGEVLTECHRPFALTVSAKLKSQFDSFLYKLTKYNLGNYTKYPFLNYIIRNYGYCFNIFYLFNYLFYLNLLLLALPFKVIIYIVYLILMSYKYWILIKTNSAYDIYSYNELYLVYKYTKLNIKFLEKYFDSYGNLNWYYKEELKEENWIQYLSIWILTNIILKPYYITFNHFISITYIFNAKQLEVIHQWDNSLEEIKYIYKRVDNPFSLNIRFLIFLLYIINIVGGYIARHFQEYKLNAKNMKIINYINTSEDIIPIKIKKIIWLSLQLGNLNIMSLSFWWRFKLSTSFGEENYKKSNFTKRIVKDKESYIYEFPLAPYGKLPNQFCEVFNFVYTILYIK